MGEALRAEEAEKARHAFLGLQSLARPESRAHKSARHRALEDKVAVGGANTTHLTLDVGSARLYRKCTSPGLVASGASIIIIMGIFLVHTKRWEHELALAKLFKQAGVTR